MPERVKYRIYGRRQYEVNTDPQRRCYWGVHASSEWIWSGWRALGCVFTLEEAEESVKSWGLCQNDRCEYKFNLETSEFPELDPYYKSKEFLNLGENKCLK